MVSFLTDLGFAWDPHRASEGRDQGAAPRMAMMKKAQPQPEKVNGSASEVQPRDGGLDHVNADLDVAIGDLEDRAARLRDLLEEEEILVEQASRLGQALRSELGDARDYVCKYLDDVHRQLMQFQCLRERVFLRSVRKQGNEDHDIDYEKLLDELEGDLDIVQQHVEGDAPATNADSARCYSKCKGAGNGPREWKNWTFGFRSFTSIHTEACSSGRMLWKKKSRRYSALGPWSRYPMPRQRPWRQRGS